MPDTALPMAEGRPAPSRGIVACLILTTIATGTMLAIEWLNVRAGGILPRQVVFDDFRNPKWRTRHLRGLREDMESEIRGWGVEGPSEGPITAEEDARVEAAVERARCENALHDVVGTWGQLQYLVAPMALVLAWIVALAPASRTFGAVCGVLSATAIVAMFYRAYFASLGW